MKSGNVFSNLIKQFVCFVSRQTGLAARLCGMVMLCLFIHTNTSAQSAQLILSVSKTSVNATNEELVDIMMKIQNNSSKLLEASAYVTVANNLELVSKAETPFVMQPGDSVFIPVKIFVNKKAQSEKTYLISFSLRDKSNVVLAQARSLLKVITKRNVNLFAMVSNILLDNSMDSIVIPVRVLNAGNTAQKITLVNHFPATVQDQAFHGTRQIVLQPSTDTLIYFSNPVNRKMINSEGFNVTITGLYENSDVIGMAYIRVQSARSNRVYRDNSGSDAINENTITLSSQSMFAPTQSYMLRARGSYDLSKARLDYNVDLTAWKPGYAPPLLQNTYVSYQTTKAGIMAGNINRMLDINLAGRGVSVFLNDTASANRYEAGYIDGNTNLLGKNSNSFFPTGEAAWGIYTHTGKKWQLNSFAVYEINPMMNTRNLIQGNSFVFTTPKNIHYVFSANAGHASEYINTNSQKFGMAISAGVTGTIKNFSFNSTNYYSTGYYPGLQKGGLNFSERLTWLRPASSLWVNFDYYRYKPQNLSSVQFYFLPAFGMLRAEAGISGKINKINFSVAPGYTQETSNAYQFAGTANDIQYLNAWNITGTLNYLIASNHYVSMNTEAGIYASSFDPVQRFHLRSNALYKKGIFSMNATLQLGTFFLGEAANNYVSKINSTYTVNLIPTIQKNFFRNKLRTEASVAYMISGYAGSSWYLTGRVEYDVTPKTAFYTSLNHNRYAGYGSSILEMGITKKLQLPKAGAKTSSMEIFVYKDFNLNGRYDATDSATGGYMLYINNDIFITASNGNIIYKNLPDDNYRLTMPVNNGWYAPEQYIKLDRKVRIEIPLQRTGVLRGTIAYTSNEFSYEISNDRSGIMVSATDSSNHTFRTKTGPDGRFVFYIPAGDYVVSLDREGLPLEVETANDNQHVKIDPENIKIIHFEIKVNPRKIGTKKFVSPSLQKKN